MMDILMSETCWAHKKWNKIARDIKLVLHSSTITMMHGPINIRFRILFSGIRHCVAGKEVPMTWTNISFSFLGYVTQEEILEWHTLNNDSSTFPSKWQKLLTRRHHTPHNWDSRPHCHEILKTHEKTRNSPRCCHDPGIRNTDSHTSEVSFVCVLTSRNFLPLVTYWTACQYNLRIYSMKLQVISRSYPGIHHKGLKKQMKNFCRIVKCSAQHKICKKQSHYRPGQALRVPGVWGSQITG